MTSRQIPQRVRESVLNRDGRECRHCGTTEPVADIELHHIIAYNDGGEHSSENLVVLCNRCHKSMHALAEGGEPHTIDVLEEAEPGQYDPSDVEHQVMDIVAEEFRVTNRHVREQIELPPERVDPALNNLEKAGWVKRLTRGFYELVEDPRKD